MFGETISSMAGKKRNLREIIPQELAGKLRSKDDFYQYLDKHLQYYLPPKTQVNKDFLRQIFADDKKLLKKKQVDYVHVSHFQELSVKNLWKDLQNDETFNIYFQDKYADQKVPCRKYFFDILNTIYPEYLSQIMNHAAKERYSGEGEAQKERAIKTTDAWLEELKKMPFISQKKGKTLHLLKASAKPINPNKKRKIIPLLGTITEFHHSSQVQREQNENKQNSSQQHENFTIGAKSEAGNEESDME